MKIQDSELVEIEIAEALDTYRTQHTLLVQLVTVLIIINASIIGIAIEKSNFHLVLVGGFCQLAILFTRMKAYQMMIPIMYSAYHLEEKSESKNTDWIILTFMATTFEHIFKDFQRINEITDRSERLSELRKTCLSFKNRAKNTTNLICLCLFLIQFIIGIWGKTIYCSLYS